MIPAHPRPCAPSASASSGGEDQAVHRMVCEGLSPAIDLNAMKLSGYMDI